MDWGRPVGGGAFLTRGAVRVAHRPRGSAAWGLLAPTLRGFPGKAPTSTRLASPEKSPGPTQLSPLLLLAAPASDISARSPRSPHSPVSWLVSFSSASPLETTFHPQPTSDQDTPLPNKHHCPPTAARQGHSSYHNCGLPVGFASWQPCLPGTQPPHWACALAISFARKHPPLFMPGDPP